MPLNVSDSERSELLATYAALILHDDKAPITADNIAKLIEASGATIEPYFPKLFASILDGQDVTSMINNIGGGGGGGAAPAAGGAAAGGAAPAAAEKKEEAKKKEATEESGGDMGFSLFD